MKKIGVFTIIILSFCSHLKAQDSPKSDSATVGVTAVDVIKNYIAAIGGEKAIKSISDIKVVSKGMIVMNGKPQLIVLTNIRKAPAKFKVRSSFMGMEQKAAFNGVNGYFEIQEVKPELDDDALRGLKQKADMYAILDREKYGDKITFKRIDHGAYVIEVKDPAGKKSVEHYDVKTGYLIKQTKYVGDFGEATTEYADYREVPGANGYKIPYSVKTSIAGHMVPTTVETVEINKGIADTEFE